MNDPFASEYWPDYDDEPWLDEDYMRDMELAYSERLPVGELPDLDELPF